MVSAVGQGVLFSLALTGLVRIVYWLSGASLPENVANRLFMISSLLTGALCAFLYSRALKSANPKSDASARLSNSD
jgi:hypothetical protein